MGRRRLFLYAGQLWGFGVARKWQKVQPGARRQGRVAKICSCDLGQLASGRNMQL